MGRGQGTDFGATGLARRQEQTDFSNRERGGAVSPRDTIAEWTSWFDDVDTVYEASREHNTYAELDAPAREACARLGFEPTGDGTSSVLSLSEELSEWASNATLGAPWASPSWRARLLKLPPGEG